MKDQLHPALEQCWTAGTVLVLVLVPECQNFSTSSSNQKCSKLVKCSCSSTSTVVLVALLQVLLPAAAVPV
jgi:hypothetical protein